MAERGKFRDNHLTTPPIMDVKALLKKWGVGVKELSFSKWSHHFSLLIFTNIYDLRQTDNVPIVILNESGNLCV